MFLIASAFILYGIITVILILISLFYLVKGTSLGAALLFSALRIKLVKSDLKLKSDLEQSSIRPRWSLDAWLTRMENSWREFLDGPERCGVENDGELKKSYHHRIQHAKTLFTLTYIWMLGGFIVLTALIALYSAVVAAAKLVVHRF